MSADTAGSSALPRRFITIALPLLALAGCSLVPSFLGGPPTIRIGISADLDANRHSATAVDLAMSTSDDASAKLLKLTARDWFNQRQQLLRDDPDNLKVVSWELAPGQSIPATAIDGPAGFRDAFIFAGYAAPGDHRLRLGDVGAVRLALGTTDMRLEP